MALPASGTISMSQINTEFGRGTDLNSYRGTSFYVGAAGPYYFSSGAISFSSFFSTSKRLITTITIGANTANYTLNTAKVSGYGAGLTDVTLVINSGVNVYSNSTGTAALIVDTSWAAGDTVTIVNNGTILGRGGAGNGGGGGLGLLVQRYTTITNNNRIAGGGGGGGLGASTYNICVGTLTGGGGGGGIGNGSGGGPGGGAGTLTSAGYGNGGQSVSGTCEIRESPFSYSGTAGYGGSGGTYGAAGETGGDGYGIANPGCCNTGFAYGYAGGAGGGSVSGNGNINWLAYGTRNGGIS